jgi:Predicted phosphohydrolases
MSIIKWLHLSDYHWGEHGQSFDRDQARVHLLEDVRSMVSTIGPLNAIFFTGDLVWSGKKTEYKEAARFLDQLLETAGNLSKEHLFVVPGNHDVTWDKITTAVATLCEGLIPRDQSDIERVRRTVNNLLGRNCLPSCE